MEQLNKSKVKTHIQQFDRGRELLKTRRDSWSDMADAAASYFESIKFECGKQNFFKRVQVYDSRGQPDVVDYLPSILLALGPSTIGFKKFGEDNVAMEERCVLLLTQSAEGYTAAVFFPYSSDLSALPEKYLVTNMYDFPWEVTDIELNKLTHNLFSYAQVSSIYGQPRLVDKIRVWKMRMDHWWLNFKLKEAMTRFVSRVSEEGVKKAIGS